MEELDKEQKKQEYNNIPVHFCKSCLSLNIRTTGEDSASYCDICGYTDIGLVHIKEWETLFDLKYNNIN